MSLFIFSFFRRGRKGGLCSVLARRLAPDRKTEAANRTEEQPRQPGNTSLFLNCAICQVDARKTAIATECSTATNPGWRWVIPLPHRAMPVQHVHLHPRPQAQPPKFPVAWLLQVGLVPVVWLFDGCRAVSCCHGCSAPSVFILRAYVRNGHVCICLHFFQTSVDPRVVHIGRDYISR